MTVMADSQTDTQADARKPKPRRGLRFWGVLGLLNLVGLAGFMVFRHKFETYHLATVEPNVLYRDGNRGVRELDNAVEKVKPRTVVSLIEDRELADPEKPEFEAEMKYLEKKGVRVERIPVKLGGWPSRESVQRFLAVVNDKENQPVLVHCAQGVRRTGMMVAAYQQAMLGYNDGKAKEAILTFGHSQRTVGDVQRFIEGYDPATGAVPEGLEEGKE